MKCSKEAGGLELQGEKAASCDGVIGLLQTCASAFGVAWVYICCTYLW